MGAIKFRAWAPQMNEMLDNNWVYENYSRMAKDSINRLGQYTGLHDKNGKEIYKSDICQCFSFDDKDLRHEVAYQNGAFGYWVTDEDFISFAENHNFKWENGKSEFIEVIGNIWENPELLREAI